MCVCVCVCIHLHTCMCANMCETMFVCVLVCVSHGRETDTVKARDLSVCMEKDL